MAIISFTLKQNIMKGIFRILLFGALLFAVTQVIASDQAHKTEISKHLADFQPAAAEFNEIVIERVDLEVLVISQTNETEGKLSKPVTQRANAPPKKDKTPKSYSMARSC